MQKSHASRANLCWIGSFHFHSRGRGLYNSHVRLAWSKNMNSMRKPSSEAGCGREQSGLKGESGEHKEGNHRSIMKGSIFYSTSFLNVIQCRLAPGAMLCGRNHASLQGFPCSPLAKCSSTVPRGGAPWHLHFRRIPLVPAGPRNHSRQRLRGGA